MTNLTKHYSQPSYNPDSKSWETTVSLVGDDGRVYSSQTFQDGYKGGDPNRLPAYSQINTNPYAAAMGVPTGARIGSIFGLKGTVVGAALGATYGFLNDGYHSIVDTIYDTFNPRYSPQQIQSMMAAAARKNRSLLGPRVALAPSLKNRPTPQVSLLGQTNSKNKTVSQQTMKMNTQLAALQKQDRAVVEAQNKAAAHQKTMEMNTQLAAMQRQDRAVVEAQNKAAAAQKAKEEKQAAKTQQHMNNYSKAQASAHQQSQEAHNNAAAQHGTYGGNASGKTGFEGSPEMGASRADAPHNQTGKDFGGKTGPTTGMLGTTNEKDAISGGTGTHNLSGGAAKDTLGAGRNSRDIGKANAERAAAIGNLNSSNQNSKSSGDGGQNSNTDENGFNNETGYRDDDPSTAKDESGFKDVGSWFDAIDKTINTGWHGSPNKNPHDDNKNNETETTSNDDGGFCYITTAAVTHMGLPDQCEELETLRWFRDNVMMTTEEGRDWIAEYYRTAPFIVKRLNASPYSDHIYKGMFHHYIVPAVDAVKKSNNVLAFEYYHGLVEYAYDLASEN